MSIHEAHGSIEDVDCTELSGVVPAILAAGKGMEIEVYTYAIFMSHWMALRKYLTQYLINPTKWLKIVKLASRQFSQGRARLGSS